MRKKTLQLLIATILFTFPLNAFSMTPEEYCQVHDESGTPGTCTERGDCAILTTNLGTEECKKCTDGGCELTDCSECSE